MNYLKKFFGHLKTVLTHKRWVFYYTSRLGYGWRGNVHDLSMFSPVEFFEGVKYWTGNRSPILSAKDDRGFSMAWLHHKGRNKHHYEYWVDKFDEGGIPVKIPFKYVIEMVCDWLSAYRTYSGTGEFLFRKEYEWWCSKQNSLVLQKETKWLIYKILWNLYGYWAAHGDWSEKRILNQISQFLPYWKKLYEEGDILDSKLLEYEI